MEKLHSFYFWGQILSYQIDMKLIIEELRDRKLVPLILNKYYHLMDWIFGGHKFKIYVPWFIICHPCKTPYCTILQEKDLFVNFLLDSH